MAEEAAGVVIVVLLLQEAEDGVEEWAIVRLVFDSMIPDLVAP
jgi:hypothetical protein